MLPQTKASLEHILEHRKAYLEDRKNKQLPSRPLVVGVSGCQGSGKTTLCDTLSHLLGSEPHNLNVVSFSLDDFYLTRGEQAKLTKANEGNPLFQYRGQPGSHDVDLLKRTLAHLVQQSEHQVRIPSYDKSLFGGLGDRLPLEDWKPTMAPYDVILFEGWSQGFKPLLSDELERVHRHATPNSCIAKLPLAYLSQMNTNLEQYESQLYSMFDIFIHLSPAKLEQVYNWRLQQEHHMKATRGVQGMSDQDVRAFVDTYMPAYELYLPRLDKVGFFGQGPQRHDRGYSAPGRHLRIVLDQERRVIDSVHIKEHLQPNSLSSTNNMSPVYRFSRLLFTCTVFGALGFLGYTRRHRVTDIFMRLIRGRS
ncbi:P-loop containing nucleoside triphosphate hydrolase protein [Lichtheimia hyalospora FSU 10163]|nr:P-loop containing nucleoside triphosphate hydrolase protein [Lichtheimia hyalospora FSU 10163]